VQNSRADRVIRHPTTFCGSQSSTILSRILSLSRPPCACVSLLFHCPQLYAIFCSRTLFSPVLDPFLSSCCCCFTATKNQGVLHTPLPNRIFLDLEPSPPFTPLSCSSRSARRRRRRRRKRKSRGRRVCWVVVVFLCCVFGV